MSKKKKLKPGQLCTIVDKHTGDRYVFQATRYDGRPFGICMRCKWENYIFSMLCPADCLEVLCPELFDPETYPKVIKHVKSSQFNQ